MSKLDGKHRRNKATNSHSKSVVQKLVTSQITFQSSDVKTVRVIEAAQSRYFDREANFVSGVRRGIPIDGFVRSFQGESAMAAGGGHG
jgi:hypothetical protein